MTWGELKDIQGVLSGVTVFNNDINDRQMVESECEFTESHLACKAHRSAWLSGVCSKEPTDILRSILSLREHGWNFGHVESFRVEHGVISTVVHGIEDDLELDNRVRRGQLRFGD